MDRWECNLQPWTQQIEKQCTSDCRADHAAEKVASEAVDDIPHQLHADDPYGKPPSPTLAAEPTDSSSGQCRTEQNEKRTHDSAVRYELCVSGRIEFPSAIEDRPGKE